MSHTRKTRRYKTKSLEWKKAAIKVKKKKGKKEENSYHFTPPALGPINSNPHPNQMERTGTKQKKESTPKERNGIRKIRNRLSKLTISPWKCIKFDIWVFVQKLLKHFMLKFLKKNTHVSFDSFSRRNDFFFPQS